MSYISIKVYSRLVPLSFGFTFAIILFGTSVTGCSFTQKEDDNFDCSSCVNDSIDLRVRGDVRYVGFTDMIFSREITLFKGEDSININLGESEFRAVLMKELQIDSLTNRFIFYNKDDAKKVIVDFNTFKVERSKSILDSIRDPHKLEGREFVLCAIPGTNAK